MRRRAFILLGASLPLAACVESAPPVYPPGPTSLGQPGLAPGAPAPLPGAATPIPAGPHVALLLPLSGDNATLAQTLQQAAQLALGGPGAPGLDVRDTMGTPEGAAAAARQALATGATLILGPLTAPETAAAAPLARAANVPVLAFTSDPSQAQPGVWVMGITPAQQVRRLVAAAQADGRSRFAGLLEADAFGNALTEALTGSLAEVGLPAPDIRRVDPGFSSLNTTLADLSDFTDRRAAIEAHAHPTSGSEPPPVPPPPFDALLVSAVGPHALELAPLLAYYGIGAPQVRVLGPGLWASQVSRLGSLAGAWYADPDPAAEQGFQQLYAARYGSPPPRLASIAFDAAAIARVLAAQGGPGYPLEALTRPDGFSGANGLLVLLPDGHVRRGLGVFEIESDGTARMVQPPPTSLTGSAS
ncbi:MAG TPA: penicillin-binding protein activator [Acetobacteraceae bacterium]|nr:penicillin-binding protein activator [Acetobacteraceae bacterium]